MRSGHPRCGSAGAAPWCGADRQIAGGRVTRRTTVGERRGRRNRPSGVGNAMMSADRLAMCAAVSLAPRRCSSRPPTSSCRRQAGSADLAGSAPPASTGRVVSSATRRRRRPRRHRRGVGVVAADRHQRVGDVRRTGGGLPTTVGTSGIDTASSPDDQHGPRRSPTAPRPSDSRTRGSGRSASGGTAPTVAPPRSCGSVPRRRREPARRSAAASRCRHRRRLAGDLQLDGTIGSEVPAG